MTKKEKLRLIVDKVLTECQGQNTIVAMLKPILTNFISQMEDKEVDRMIEILKAIIRYLEDEGTKEDEEIKKATIKTE